VGGTCWGGKVNPAARAAVAATLAPTNEAIVMCFMRQPSYSNTVSMLRQYA
jgi:hypothetical protein